MRNDFSSDSIGDMWPCHRKINRGLESRNESQCLEFCIFGQEDWSAVTLGLDEILFGAVLRLLGVVETSYTETSRIICKQGSH